MIDTKDKFENLDGTSAAVLVSTRFREARLSRTSLPDFPGELPLSLQDSYLTQDQAIKDWPDTVKGWKVGRILGDLIEVHGTDRLLGPIFETSVLRDEPNTSLGFRVIDGGFCAVEGEYVFELGQDADPACSSYTPDTALSLIAMLWTGVEIAASPLATINKLGPTVVVSDFGNNWGLVLGHPIDNWQQRLEGFRVCTRIDGTEVGNGSVSAFPGGIVQSLVFALNQSAKRGMPLKRGMLISTGAVSGVHDLEPGQYAQADFGPDGLILCHRLASP